MSDGFTCLPNALFDDPSISHLSFRLYATLAKHQNEQGECVSGQDALAMELNVSERSIYTALKDLEQRKLIEVEQRGTGETNRYTLMQDRKPTSDQVGSRLPTTLMQDRKPTSDQSRAPASISTTKEYTPPLTPPLRQVENVSYPDDFSRFWIAYPKGHGSKKLSYECWTKLTLPDREEARLGLELWKGSRRWTEDDGRYVVDCERYLKRRYWENPPELSKRDEYAEQKARREAMFPGSHFV